MAKTISDYTTQELLARWEAQRAVKNLMGKYSHCQLLKRELAILHTLWSGREDVCLGTNEGWYEGRQAVEAYYDGLYRLTELCGSLIRDAFPGPTAGLSPEQLHGAGSLDHRGLLSELVEVAADGQTAKGLWVEQGSFDKMSAAGNVGRWFWGYIAADFIRENGAWRIWHMQALRDVDHPCGEKWWEPEKKREAVQGFEAMEQFSMPQPTLAAPLRRAYAAGRPFCGAPRMPEPYDSFGETFSYGRQ